MSQRAGILKVKNLLKVHSAHLKLLSSIFWISSKHMAFKIQKLLIGGSLESP